MTCTVCAADVPDGIYLCHADAERLEYDLAETSAVWADLQTTIARLDKGADSIGGGGGGSRPPVNLDALDKGQTLRVILTGWTQLLPGLHPAGDPDKVAAWLLGQVNVIRRMGWAGDLVTELRDALNTCRRATDRAERRVFAGVCPTIGERDEPCQTPIYVREGRPEARCPTCGNTWDVSEWRERAFTAALIHEGTASQVSRMLSDPVTGEALPQGTIRQWVHRGKLVAIGSDGLGRPVYQVRKVRNLWARMKAKAYARAA